MRKRINNLIELYRDFTERAYAPFTGIHKKGVFICNIAFSLYVTTVISMLTLSSNIPLLLFTIYQITKLCLIKWSDLRISCLSERCRLQKNTFIICSSIIFAVLIINLLAHYPGGISGDSLDQWNQVQTGNFNNWHPAIHTMIIWLITRIVPFYSFFICFQILCFSILSGYMAATIEAWGIKKRWVIIFMITIISTQTTRNIMLYPWKDTAFTVLVLCLSVYMVNIVLSRGLWLTKWYNTSALAVVGALASIIRHNSFFFTVPLGILLITFYTKSTRNTIIAVISSILVVLGITNILYPLANVTYPTNQTYVESVRLPMTILSGVMVNKPEALDQQTKEFLLKIVDEQEWMKTYKSGNFNSIEWYFDTTDIISEIPPGDLIMMTLRAIINAPMTSLREFIALTRMVWSPLDWRNISVITDEGINALSDNELVFMQQIRAVGQVINSFFNAAFWLFTPSSILGSIGLHMTTLLVIGVYSINRNMGVKGLFLIIPSVMYNLGTMLLLGGPDYRFFHFNTVVTLPLIIALLASSKHNEDQSSRTKTLCSSPIDKT